MNKPVRNALIGVGVAVVAALGLVIVFAVVLIASAIRGHQAAERAGNEAATIQNMKTISAVETQYFKTHNLKFATIDQLVREQMMSSKFLENPPVADGYVLTLSLTPKPASPGSSYTLAADPRDNSSGTNHFYCDSTSDEIHVNSKRQAGPGDPLLTKR
ncbi:MAG TPA: hypothetical protein VF397_02080 [Pyrinomonadaceae bacterium]